jgi:hypothetical protein
MLVSLSILEDPITDSNVWKHLSDEEQKTVVEVLARLIAQVAMSLQNEEQNHD